MLGVCLGLQLLFQRSEEGDVGCLGLLPGTVSLLRGAAGSRTWAGTTSRPSASTRWPSRCRRLLLRPLLRRAGRAGRRRDRRDPVEGGRFASIVGRDRILGAQFHPERSADGGRALLRAALSFARGRAVLRRRILPCLDVSGGRVVKGVNFVNLRDCGDPVEAAVRYAGQGADEIVWLNITSWAEDWPALLDAVERAAEQVDVPVTVGGGIRDERHVRELLLAGADKASINSAALRRPQLLSEAADRFGSQCVVCAIDARRATAAGRRSSTAGAPRPAGTRWPGPRRPWRSAPGSCW